MRILVSRFRLMARYFLLPAQEKVPKEKGTRCPHRLTPIPCVPRQSGGRAQLGARTGLKIPPWLASNRVRVLVQDCLRYSVRATGPWMPPCPVGAAEHRSSNRGKRVACLSNRDVCDCEFDERRLLREAQDNRAAIKPQGVLSFRPFSLDEQRKGARSASAEARVQIKYLAIRRNLTSYGASTGVR